MEWEGREHGWKQAKSKLNKQMDVAHLHISTINRGTMLHVQQGSRVNRAEDYREC